MSSISVPTASQSQPRIHRVVCSKDSGRGCCRGLVYCLELLTGVHESPYEHRLRVILGFLTVIAATTMLLLYGCYRLVEYFVLEENAPWIDLAGGILEVASAIFCYANAAAFLCHKRFYVMIYIFVVPMIFVLSALHIFFRRGFNSVALLFLYLCPHGATMVEVPIPVVIEVLSIGAILGNQVYDIVDPPPLENNRYSLILFYLAIGGTYFLLYLTFLSYVRKFKNTNRNLVAVARAISTLDLENSDVVKLEQKETRNASEIFVHIKKIITNMHLYLPFLPASLKSKAIRDQDKSLADAEVACLSVDHPLSVVPDRSTVSGGSSAASDELTESSSDDSCSVADSLKSEEERLKSEMMRQECALTECEVTVMVVYLKSFSDGLRRRRKEGSSDKRGFSDIGSIEPRCSRSKSTAEVDGIELHVKDDDDDEIPTPADLVAMQQAFLQRVDSIILRGRGLVHDYRGGTVVASFNTKFRKCMTHAEQASKTAFNIAKAFESLGNRFKVRIVLCSGLALCGNTGCEAIRRFEVLGDPVDRALSAVRRFGDILPDPMTILVDRDVRKKVRFEYNTCEMDFDPRTGMSMYWLKGLRDSFVSRVNDEWMYKVSDVLDVDDQKIGSSGTFEDAVSSAWDAFSRKDYNGVRKYVQLAEEMSHCESAVKEMAMFVRTRLDETATMSARMDHSAEAVLQDVAQDEKVGIVQEEGV